MRPLNRQKFIIALTITYAVLVLAGLIFLVLTSASFKDIITDLIAFLISGSSILIALLSQISAERSQNNMERMQQEINIIDDNITTDLRTDHSIQRKLDRIIEMDEKIYKKLGGRIPKN